MTAMIQMEHIVKNYDKTRVLSDLDLTIEKGTFLTVVGSSGCGKTTLLKMINRTDPPGHRAGPCQRQRPRAYRLDRAAPQHRIQYPGQHSLSPI